MGTAYEMQSASERLISPNELADHLDAGTVGLLLDVRSREEHEAWAIPGSTNIPLDELSAWLATLPSACETVVYCASGTRSASAAEVLAADRRQVFDLSGGMHAWANSYEVVTLPLDDIKILQFRRRGKGCLSYLIESGGQAVVVDPSVAIEQYIDAASALGSRILTVIDTHLHADHLSGASALAAATGSTLLLSEHEGFAFAHEPALNRKGTTAFSSELLQLEVGPNRRAL